MALITYRFTSRMDLYGYPDAVARPAIHAGFMQLSKRANLQFVEHHNGTVLVQAYWSQVNRGYLHPTLNGPIMISAAPHPANGWLLFWDTADLGEVAEHEMEHLLLFGLDTHSMSQAARDAELQRRYGKPVEPPKMNRQQAIVRFLEAPETKQLIASMSKEEFVDWMYRKLLGREPDAAGRKWWLENVK